ncbi:MAG TPA: hypothetical protein VFI43_03865, partial [Nitrosospira sp.]|nr:hypothetical protein [Nitrosospira sp.]
GCVGRRRCLLGTEAALTYQYTATTADEACAKFYDSMAVFLGIEYLRKFFKLKTQCVVGARALNDTYDPAVANGCYATPDSLDEQGTWRRGPAIGSVGMDPGKIIVAQAVLNRCIVKPDGGHDIGHQQAGPQTGIPGCVGILRHCRPSQALGAKVISCDRSLSFGDSASCNPKDS